MPGNTKTPTPSCLQTSATAIPLCTPLWAADVFYVWPLFQKCFHRMVFTIRPKFKHHCLRDSTIFFNDAKELKVRCRKFPCLDSKKAFSKEAVEQYFCFMLFAIFTYLASSQCNNRIWPHEEIPSLFSFFFIAPPSTVTFDSLAHVTFL